MYLQNTFTVHLLCFFFNWTFVSFLQDGRQVNYSQIVSYCVFFQRQLVFIDARDATHRTLLLSTSTDFFESSTGSFLAVMGVNENAICDRISCGAQEMHDVDWEVLPKKYSFICPMKEYCAVFLRIKRTSVTHLFFERNASFCHCFSEVCVSFTLFDTIFL